LRSGGLQKSPVDLMRFIPTRAQLQWSYRIELRRTVGNRIIAGLSWGMAPLVGLNDALAPASASGGQFIFKHAARLELRGWALQGKNSTNLAGTLSGISRWIGLRGCAGCGPR